MDVIFIVSEWGYYLVRIFDRCEDWGCFVIYKNFVLSGLCLCYILFVIVNINIIKCILSLDLWVN